MDAPRISDGYQMSFGGRLLSTVALHQGNVMVETNTGSNSGPNRRRSECAPRDLQKKIALVAFSVGTIGLMFNLQFGLIGLWMIYLNPADTVEGVLQQTKNMMGCCPNYHAVRSMGRTHSPLQMVL
jgi:hypothetical protein